MGKRTRGSEPSVFNGVPAAAESRRDSTENPSPEGSALHSRRALPVDLPLTVVVSRGGSDLAEIQEGVIRRDERRRSPSPAGEDELVGEIDAAREDDMDPFFSNYLEDDFDAVVHGFSPPPTPAMMETSGAAPSRSTRVKKAKPNTNKTERTKWSAQEDEVLVSAWLNVSQDPIVGKDQSSETYWSRIAEYYKSNCNEHMKARSKKGLVNHWSLINECVSKYDGYLNQTDGLHQSGTTERDRMTHAGRMYQDIEGKPFTFHHCWVLLSDHPKWSSHLSHKKQKTVRCGVTHEGSNDIPIDLASQASSEERERPPGRRRGSSSMSSVGAYSEHFEKMNELRCAMVDIQREKLAMAKEAENERIMKVDLESCTGLLRKYYENRQIEIIMACRQMNK